MYTSRMSDESQAHDVIIIDEMARYFNVHRSTIFRLPSLGHLPGFKIGRGTHFFRSQINEWCLA
jgi:excisionase family DNA binding protein